MPTRDLRLDSLRGIFLVLMTIDHLGGKLNAYTYEPFGFVSAAAAFVMLSAYMYAYTTRGTAPSLAALGAQSLKRAARLYRYHLGLFLLVVLLTLLSPVHADYLDRHIYPADMSLRAALLYGAALVHQPPFMDLLPMYLFLSLLSPVLLMAFHRRWYGLVFTLSLAFWLCGQFFDPLEWLAEFSGSGARAGAFNVLSWQLLWVAGLYIGFNHGVEKRNVFFRQPLCLWIAIVTATGFFLARHGVIPFASSLEFYLEKADLRILRLANIFSQVVIFCHLVKFVRADTGLAWFRFIGRYSLQVFCFHVLLVNFLMPLSWRIGMLFGYAGEVLYFLAAAASLTLPALLYRAYETQLRAGGKRTWPDKLAAMRRVGRNMLTLRRLSNRGGTR
jgi:hypothetical protein